LKLQLQECVISRLEPQSFKVSNYFPAKKSLLIKRIKARNQTFTYL